MRRRAKTAEANTTTDEARDALADEVRQLREEVRVVWEAVDELREALEHALRNPPEPPPPSFRLTSMAADPTADDFAERLNAIPQQVIEAFRAEAVASRQKENGPKPAGKQGRLFF
jgi:ABC-type transporter Mla subunit MlaD